MILIVSTKNDESTNHVIDWLVYYGKQCVRITPESIALGGGYQNSKIIKKLKDD